MALPADEVLSYGVEWRLIRAGTVVLSWRPERQQTPDRWETALAIESTGLVSKFFKVNDRYTSLLNAELCSLSSFLKAEEGSRKRETRVTFDAAARKASYLERDLARNGAVVASHEIDVPACVHDVVGGLFFLRSVRLQPGESIETPVSDGKKFVLARVEAQAREKIKTPAGGYDTIRYEAFLFNNVLYRRSGRLYVWISDDARRLPVQIRARLQFHIGTITLQLEKEQRS